MHPETSALSASGLLSARNACVWDVGGGDGFETERGAGTR
jgi:hypothetical protein